MISPRFPSYDTEILKKKEDAQPSFLSSRGLFSKKESPPAYV